MTMMTKYQVYMTLYSYLSRAMDGEKEISEGAVQYMSGAEPDGKGGSRSPEFWEGFCRITDKTLKEESCTVEEGFYYAGRYLYELTWEDDHIRWLTEHFRDCTAEEWAELYRGLDGIGTSMKQCPCCGCFTLEEGGGKYEICEVCGWEDDPKQFRDPELSGGANEPSLSEARENYLRTGKSCEEASVRPPTHEELTGIKE